MDANEKPAEKFWHVDTGESVMHVDSTTLEEWIKDGAVLPHHKVSREGTRWLEVAKVPQFATFFGSNSNQTLGRPEFRRAEQEYLTRSTMNAPPPSMGLRIAAGSALALVLAFAGAYLWAYNISGQRDYNALKNEPKMVELQTKFDKDKAAIEEMRAAYIPPRASAPEPVVSSGPKLGPGMNDKFKGINAAMMDRMPDLSKIKIPNFQPEIAPRDFNGEIANMTGQFENDKALAMTEIRQADRKSRFLPALVILFIGLAGLNIARIKLFSKP